MWYTASRFCYGLSSHWVVRTLRRKSWVAGSGVGLFTVPPVGANVWVEFEGGDIDYPILAGCFWGQGEVESQSMLHQLAARLSP